MGDFRDGFCNPESGAPAGSPPGWWSDISLMLRTNYLRQERAGTLVLLRCY